MQTQLDYIRQQFEAQGFRVAEVRFEEPTETFVVFTLPGYNVYTFQVGSDDDYFNFIDDSGNIVIFDFQEE